MFCAIDQGTTSTARSCSTPGSRRGRARSKEFTQHYPASGWVPNMTPTEIWTASSPPAGARLKRAG